MHLVVDVYWFIVCMIPIRGLAAAQHPYHSPGLVTDFRQHPVAAHKYQHSSAPVVGSQIASQKLCDDPRCECLSTSVGYNVTCHCAPQDKEALLAVHPNSVPDDVALLYIYKCRDVVFHEGALKKRVNLSDVTVIDVGTVIFETGSVSHVQASLNPTVTVGRCREILVRKGAFGHNAHHPISFSSQQCTSVRIEESAFSRVQRILLSFIDQLDLDANAFRFSGLPSSDTNVINADITINSATLKGLKGFTFPSPLNRLLLKNVTIDDIESNATSALRIVHLTIEESTIGHIHPSAFSELTHLDTFQVINSRIRLIGSSAISSATSHLTVRRCRIERMAEDALNMPVARVVLDDNVIANLGSGSLHLREWNDLLIENNTLERVERHAFYNIGEPKVVDVRFVFRRNKVIVSDVGAFIFSAQAHKLQLQDNYFRHHCNCQLSTWAADLTQVNERLETTSTPISERTASAALWLGPALFNSSFCWLSKTEAMCNNIQEGFYHMNNFTSTMCPRRREIVQCMERFAPKILVPLSSGSPGFNVSDHRDGFMRPIGFSSKQDLIMVIVLAVVVAIVLISIFIGLALAKRRSKSRQDGVVSKGDLHPADRDERITCSPLLPTEHCEKHLGGGVVSSGSISRLSVKDYRSYLDELGPIYSEPTDPPLGSTASVPHTTVVDSIPPEIPAFPIQWTTKSLDSTGSGERAKMTIDRGTQTLNEEPVKPSLAQEFTDDVFAALKDTLEVSPTYCEVKDSICEVKTKETGASASAGAKGDVNVLDARDLYDVIQVVDSKPARPSTSSAASEHIYCKPWDARDSVLSKSPSSSDSPDKESKFFAANTQADASEQTSDPATSSADADRSKTASTVKDRSSSSGSSDGERRQQPFYIRGSLPKWPPPAKESGKPSTRIRTSPAHPPLASPTRFNSLTPTPGGPVSPTKDTRPPWRIAATTKPATNPTTRAPGRAASFNRGQSPQQSNGGNKSPTSNSFSPTRRMESAKTSEPEAVQPETKPEAAVTIPVPPSGVPAAQHSEGEYSNPRDHADGQYSEVTSQPFSFSFRRPLFQQRATSPPVAEAAPPSKPSRVASPVMCSDYADPRDQTDNLYAVLPSN